MRKQFVNVLFVIAGMLLCLARAEKQVIVIHELTETNFDAFIKKEKNVMVFFYTEWW